MSSETLTTRVFPPLPDDSPLRGAYEVDGVYARDNALYELRPFPHPDQAADDPHLVPFIADKGDPDWPAVVDNTDVKKFGRWLSGDSFVRSLSIVRTRQVLASLAVGRSLYVIVIILPDLSAR